MYCLFFDDCKVTENQKNRTMYINSIAFVISFNNCGKLPFDFGPLLELK